MSCGSGGGSSGGTNTIVQQSQIPADVQANYDQLTSRGFGLAGQPFPQYTGSLVAPFSDQQNQAFSEINALQGSTAPYLDSASYDMSTAGSTLDTARQDVGNASNYLLSNAPGFVTDAAGKFNTGGEYIANAADYIANQARPLFQSGAGAVNAGLGYLGDAANYISQAPSYIQTGANTLNAGLGYMGNAANYISQAPSYIGAGARELQAAPNFASNISTYENPYTTNVTDALQKLYNQQNATQQAQVAGNAVSSNAWGGDRSAVAQALTAGQQALNEAPTMANVLSQGYGQAVQGAEAQGWMQAQAGTGLGGLGAETAGLGTATAGLGTATGGIGSAQAGLGVETAGLGTATAGLGTAAGGLGATFGGLGTGTVGAGTAQGTLGTETANVGSNYGALAGTVGGLSGTLGGLGGTTAGIGSNYGTLAAGEGNLAAVDTTTRLAQANAEAAAGGQQQQLAQENLNVPYEQFVQQNAYPYQQLSFLAPLVEGTGSLSGGTGSTTYPGPSALSQIGGLGLTGLAGYGLLNNAGLLPAFLTGGALTPAEAGAASGFGSAFGAGALDLGTILARGGRVGGQRRGLADGGSSDNSTIDVSFIPDETSPQVPSGSGNSDTSSLAALQELGLITGLTGLAGAAGAYQEGGTIPGGGGIQLPSGSGPPLPAPPTINLDSLISPGPSVKGQGPPKAPSPPPGAMQNADFNPQQFLGEEAAVGKLLKGLGDGTSTPGAQFGGNVTRRGIPHIGEARMGLGHRGTGFGAEHLSPPGDIGGTRDFGLPLHLHLQEGGLASPMGGAIAGASPNVQGYFSRLAGMPPEQLQEYAARVPPGSPQGALAQRALQMQRMQPGAGATPPGTAAAMQTHPQAGPVPGTVAQPQPGGRGFDIGGTISPVSYGQSMTSPGLGGLSQPLPGMGQTLGFAEGGTAPNEAPIRETDDMDPHPIVDHSGPTVVIHYPSEKRSLDLGIPSSKEMRERYQGGGTINSGIPGVQRGLQALGQPQPFTPTPAMNPALYANGGTTTVPPMWQAPSATDAAAKMWGLAGGGRAGFDEGGDTATAVIPPPTDRDVVDLADVRKAPHELPESTSLSREPNKRLNADIPNIPASSASLAAPLPEPQLTAHAMPSPSPPPAPAAVPSGELAASPTQPTYNPDSGKFEQRQRPPAPAGSAPPSNEGRAPADPNALRSQTIEWWQKNAGVSPAVAQGIAAQINKESGFNPTLPGDSGTSIGLYQAHNERKDDLMRYANWQDPNVQHQWALGQVTGGDPTATQHWAEIKAAKTPQEASDLWQKYFERPAGTSGAGGADQLLRPGQTRPGEMERPRGPITPSPSGTVDTNITLPARTPYQPGLGASPWLALLAAGLGTMAGRSPHALTNIGTGGLEGVKVLQSQETQAAKQASLENEAQNRAATLGIESKKLGLEGQKIGQEQTNQQQMMGYRYDELNRQLKAEQDRFNIQLATEKTRDAREQDYRDHITNQDIIMGKYRQAEIMKPVAGFDLDPATGQIVAGTHVFNPDKGKYDFNPGPGVGKAPVTTDAQKDTELSRMEDSSRKNWQAAHPMGALDLKPGETMPDFRAQAEQDYAKRHGAAPPSPAAPSPPPTQQNAIPPIPNGVPPGSQYSPSRKAWRDSQGNIYDESGKKVGP